MGGGEDPRREAARVGPGARAARALVAPVEGPSTTDGCVLLEIDMRSCVWVCGRRTVPCEQTETGEHVTL